MAEADTSSCRCSNISIMQLFHQLKQRFPNVPDQIVSKVIQQNYHDRTTCEALLQRENALYSVQSYPGAIISGRGADVSDANRRIATKCPHFDGDASTQSTSDEPTSTEPSSRHSRDRSSSVASSLPLERDASSIESENVPSSPTLSSDVPPEARLSTLSLEEKIQLCKLPLGQLVREAHKRVARRASCESKDESLGLKTEYQKEESPIIPSINEPTAGEVVRNEFPDALASNQCNRGNEQPTPPNAGRSPPVRPTSFACDIPPPPNHFPYHSKVEPPPIPQAVSKRTVATSPNSLAAPSHFIPPAASSRLLTPPYETHGNRLHHRLNESYPHAQPSSAAPSQEYAVAVECVVTPGTPGDKQRSFTSVNLTLRPPSAETTLPIDICSGQSLTYTSASFDPRQGYQSHLQIRIGPVLLQHQRERKDMLARELRKNKERLRAMQGQVQSIKLALARAAMTPLLLSKLKADMEQLRGECERLTAAVDAYSQPNNQPPEQIPLGPGWNCRICTFRNHPLLSVCEECEMPRLSIGSPSALSMQHPHRVLSSHPSVFPNNNVNNPSCAGGETSTSASRTITPIQER